MLKPIKIYLLCLILPIQNISILPCNSKIIMPVRKINSLMIPKDNISTIMSSRLQFRDDFYDAQIAWNEVIKHLS